MSYSRFFVYICTNQKNMKKIGITFGCYYPLHQGHMDLIMRSKKENDLSFVFVCGAYDIEKFGAEWYGTIYGHELANPEGTSFKPCFFAGIKGFYKPCNQIHIGPSFEFGHNYLKQGQWHKCLYAVAKINF